MSFFLDSFYSALLLVFTLDEELLNVIGVSLTVSTISTSLASLVGVPLGFAIAFSSFKGKQLVVTSLNTLLAFPTVVIGLLVYSLLSRQGVFGSLSLLYTRTAIVIGQMILITPMITVFAISAVSRIDQRYRFTAMTLGANTFQSAIILIREARFSIVASVILAFGRVISEVGISMMLGGNARGYTRTMTTAIALEYDKGEYILAIALGIILLAVSFGINLAFSALQGKVDR